LILLQVETLARISFLTLPNDLLLQIFEEVQAGRGNQTGFFGFASDEFNIGIAVVNRRIYNLTRPIWLAQLSIKSDIDRRLFELLDDQPRLDHLRRLELTPSPSQAYFIRHAFSRFPHLTHFTLTLDGNATLDAHRAINEGIRRTPTLKHLKVLVGQCSEPRRNLVHSIYFEDIRNSLPHLLEQEDASGVTRFKDQYGMIARRLGTEALESDFDNLHWADYGSFRMDQPMISKLGRKLVDFLEREVASSEVSKFIVLLRAELTFRSSRAE
jgi:hypothetical protein